MGLCDAGGVFLRMRMDVGSEEIFVEDGEDACKNFCVGRNIEKRWCLPKIDLR